MQGQEGQQPLPKSQSASDGGGGQGQALAPACRYEEVPVPPDEAYGGLWRFLRAGGFDAWAADDHVLWREWVGRAPRGMEAHVLGVLSEGMTGRI